MKQVSIFNKILNRIHKRITLTARNKTNEQHIWFTIPEYIFGEPIYDKGDCIAYIVSKLEVNKFHIRYIHPNTLFISWSNWIPSYVRTEYKKKTGISVDEFGQVVENKQATIEDDVNSNITLKQSNTQGKQYPSTAQYKPTGHLVYNPDMFNSIEKKTT